MSQRSLSIILGAVLGTSLASAQAWVPKGNENGVPRTLLSRLNRGVNITRWFCYTGNQGDPAHLKSYFTPQDFSALKSLNIQFVRLCLSPDVVYDSGQLRRANLELLDEAVKKLVDANLVVLFDLHDNGQLKLDSEGKDNDGFIKFWEDAARHYRAKYRDRVVFELVNEPVFNKGNAVKWYELQEKSVKAIRAIDPARTIMVSPTEWSGIDALAKMKPLPAKNLLYTIHCYDPFFFTHQGASWVGDKPGKFKSVPFPASATSVAAVLDKNDSSFAGDLKWYGQQGYDAKYLRDRLDIGVKFGNLNHVPVVLGEFGAYPPVAQPEDRGRWFAAIREAIESTRLPHAIWGYDDALGLGRDIKNGVVALDPVTLRFFYGVGHRDPN